MDTDKLTCKMCGAQFDTEEELQEHNAKMHESMANEEQKPEGGLNCKVCGAGFNSEEELEEHERTAHGNM